ncbi:MAG TPA: AMP-binding protein [Mycobacteriales bacterium]|nr:AMP-binding protein [Mycobacteriales bacterium]
MAEQMSFATRLRQLTEESPAAPVVTDAAGTISRLELDTLSNQWARALADKGVRQGDLVSIALPSDRRFIVAAWAVWKLGATPQPLSSRIVPAELRAILEVASPSLVIADTELTDAVRCWDTTGAGALSVDPLPDKFSPSWKAPTSGGSTGRPKVILATSPATADPLLELAALFRVRPGDVLLTPAPLCHNAPFLTTTMAVLGGGHAVVMPRFDAETTVRLIEQHQVGWLYAVPTIMNRIAKLPPEVLDSADFSSIHTMFHMAAPCADWLKRWWMDRLGSDAVWELYAGTEVQAITMVGGTEWLTRPGTVGKPVVGQIKILDEDMQPADPGVVGEIFMRPPSDVPTYRYLGASARAVNGWESLGDLGWMDAEGYLYLSDRMTDMVLVGGINVYPAEVEAALEAHPMVESCCVVGLPDDDLGSRLHAVVHVSGAVTDDELAAFVAGRLAPHKRPRTYERSAEQLRDDAGKMRRSAIRESRLDRTETLQTPTLKTSA